jgi:hypothetical protein
VGGSNLAGNSNFADESNVAKHGNAAKEVCDSTNKKISGLNKRQCYKGSDATTTMATRHCELAGFVTTALPSKFTFQAT